MVFEPLCRYVTLPSVLTVTEPFVGWVLMTIELRLIAEVPAVSLSAKFTVFEADLATENASPRAVGGLAGVIVTATLAAAETNPLMSLMV